MNDDRSRLPGREPTGPLPGFDVPDGSHRKMLQQGAHAWNEWRRSNPGIRPRLGYTRLRKADLSGYDFDGADMPFCILSRCTFTGCTFRGADLRGSSLRRGDLTGANLDGAVLRHVSLAECTVQDAVFANCAIYGLSAWNLVGTPKVQSNMEISADFDEPSITVDNLEVAQLVFLLLHNRKIRDVINTVGEKGVLILGRFRERKHVLDAIKAEIGKHGLLPIVFDFERPTDRDFSETVLTLVGMSRFVVADITKPQSVPHELELTIPNFMIPFVPLIQKPEEPYAMFQDLWIKHRDWVLDPLRYSSVEQLVRVFEKGVIRPANERRQKLLAIKTGQQPAMRDADDLE